METQALEGKNVKDMLLNVGSGGGAAAAPSGGAGAGAAAAEAPAEKEEEKKEEGVLDPSNRLYGISEQTLTRVSMQRRRSRTRTWASVSLTKCTHHASILHLFRSNLAYAELHIREISSNATSCAAYSEEVIENC